MNNAWYVYPMLIAIGRPRFSPMPNFVTGSLPEAGKIELAAMPRTPAVDVLLFLDVARERTTVISALHETTESNLTLRILWPVVTGKNRCTCSTTLGHSGRGDETDVEDQTATYHSIALSMFSRPSCSRMTPRNLSVFWGLTRFMSNTLPWSSGAIASLPASSPPRCSRACIDRVSSDALPPCRVPTGSLVAHRAGMRASLPLV